MRKRPGLRAGIEVRSQLLRDLDAAAGASLPDISEQTQGSFAIGANNGRRFLRGHWRERDLERAIAVARKARLKHFRIEVAPDGTIAIVVG